jgi:hypothetical protein
VSFAAGDRNIDEKHLGLVKSTAGSGQVLRQLSIANSAKRKIGEVLIPTLILAALCSLKLVGMALADLRLVSVIEAVQKER